MPDILRAITFVVMGMFFFMLGDLYIKFAAQIMPLGMVTIFLGFGMSVFFYLLMRHNADPLFHKEYLHIALAMRCIGEGIGVIGVVIALAFSPLSTVTAIMQFLPLILTLMGALFLKEKVGIRRATALVVGFVGVLIIIRPGMQGFDLFASFTLLGVFGMSVRDIGTRMMPASISTATLSFYGAVMVCLTGIGMMLVTDDWQMPNQQGLLYCAILILMATIGTWLVSTAMRLGDVGVISPFRYIRVVFGVGAGILVLGETIDMPTILGSSIVIVAGLYSWLRERKLALAQA